MIGRTPFAFCIATITRSSCPPEYGLWFGNFFVSLKFKFTLVIVLDTDDRLGFEVLLYTSHRHSFRLTKHGNY